MSKTRAQKNEIADLNKQIYGFLETKTDNDASNVYYTCRDWSLAYFKALYDDIGVKPFDKYYPESSTADLGEQLVKQNPQVFKMSDGAMVFEGEAYGLHTRVFITKDSLPTYEAKDMGLIGMELEDFSFTRRILITGSEQSEYMKVVWQAFDLVRPGIKDKMLHLTNGLIRFGDGQKMSSRTGNVTKAVDVLKQIRQLVQSTGDASTDEQIAIGAVKYEFLKHRLGGDIAFDPEESVSLHGNSGPYLQYAYVRASSILAKAPQSATPSGIELQPQERSLVKKLSEYRLALERATQEFAPQAICGYLYELAQEFNRFYEHNLVIGDEREAIRLHLVSVYADTLKDGLGLLGITPPNKI